MAETWPISVPSKPKAGSPQTVPFRAPHATEFEDGNIRRRRSTTKNVATQSLQIEMTAAEFATFKAWVRDDLVDGTLPFTMSVWTGNGYADRECTFTQAYGDSQQAGGDHMVSVSLDVEDW